ncbi:hypothetical protein BKA82DRAFT_918320 [Pisolithus tinctorius]|uniref:Uncharacterized protein n=1 Tax=Pisolithus tinctorius Marx 270 TaxID=870435 RepID=A0A0C3NPB4_PISTI|nr:hypothetical protein BKA82DRAFT_918320 [Pisolithus tinctorius]KIN97143.1 hypothetical protein M404DRAFT_918320 [Pisolithus tinctorius Marx 270]
MTPRTVKESAISQIPELSEDDAEFDLLRKPCIRGQSAGPRPRKPSTRGTFKAKTDKSSLLRLPFTAKASTLDTTHPPFIRRRTNLQDLDLTETQRTCSCGITTTYLDTRTQSTKPRSTRQAQTQIARIRDSADTMPRTMRARICLAVVMQVLHDSPASLKLPFPSLPTNPRRHTERTPQLQKLPTWL